MDIDKAGFIQRVTGDLTDRNFRVSPPASLQPATGWDSDLDVKAGERWIALFVVEEPDELADSQWLGKRRYTPDRPSRPFALLSLVDSSSKSKVDGAPVFNFSDYEQGLNRLVAWLRQLEASGGGDGPDGGIPDPGAARPLVPIGEALQRFTFSPEAEKVMEFASAIGVFYRSGTAVLWGEILVFAVAECGTFNPERAPGFFSRQMEKVPDEQYVHALERLFPQWNRTLPKPADVTVRQVSANTMDILAGAELIARRVSGEATISARHLIAALYVIRPSERDALTAADYAHGLGVPDIRKPILDYVRAVIPGDNPGEWDPVLSKTWTVEELRADRALGVRAASLSDAVATRDRLGFEPYVNAVAAFITNPETQAPLTLAVEGEWGSGKSSFMRQVEAVIRGRPGGEKPTPPGWPRRVLNALNPRYDPGPLTVWFNPWRHDREEALWAAFALEFLGNISGQLPPMRRWRGHLKLLQTRFSWRDGGWDVVRMLLLAALAATVLVTLVTLVFFDPKFVKLFTSELVSEKGKGLVGVMLKVGGTAGALALAVSLIKEVKSFVSNPLRVGLKQHVRAPDYQTRISFIEEFHRDFGKMVGAYAGGRKVFVFIDDLDRCQVPRAADLMQALNLMIADEQPLVFIIGMDREKIAASLAVKFKDVIPYFSGAGSLSDVSWAHAEAAAGLEYGSEFIEKFVQVSIRVPQPRESDITRLLEDLSPGSAGRSALPAEPAPAAGAAHPAATRADAAAPAGSPSRGAAPVQPTLPDEATRRALRRKVSVDSPRLHDIVRLVAPVLDYNPRRVKQFINACRLQAYIAIETGLIGDEGGKAASDLTFEKLSKFVALTLRWPLLVAHLEHEPNLLQQLESIALDNLPSTSPTEIFWASRARLMDLLRAELRDQRGQPVPHAQGTYAFAGVDVAQLLRVTGGTPVVPAGPPPAEPTVLPPPAAAPAGEPRLPPP